MGVEKRVYSFRLEDEVIDMLKILSDEQNRSLSNLVETILKDHIKTKTDCTVPKGNNRLLDSVLSNK